MIYSSLSAVSPQDINKHVKTSVNNLSGAVHYMAPESGLLYVSLVFIIIMVPWMLLGEEKLSQASDVYAFGICALEVQVLALGDIWCMKCLSRCWHLSCLGMVKLALRYLRKISWRLLRACKTSRTRWAIYVVFNEVHIVAKCRHL